MTEATTPQRGRSPAELVRRLPAPYAIAVFVGSVGCYLLIRWLTHPSMVDLLVYRAEGMAVRTGHDVYGTLSGPEGLRATYPPFAAQQFAWLTLIPTPILVAAAVAANLGLVVVVSWLSCRLVGVAPRDRGTVTLLLAAVVIWSEPVFTSLRYGQINLLLLALVLWDFSRRPNTPGRGVALGFAAGIKVVPGVFIVYLLATRRFRMATVAGATFAVTVVGSALMLPEAAWNYWTRLVFDTDRVGRPENAANQSVRGLLVRVEHTRELSPAWLLLSAALLTTGLAIAVFAYRHLGDRWGLPACAVASLLAAPISWTHHWVWCVPIALLLWREARRWAVCAVVFWTFAVWAVPHTDARELSFSTWQIGLSLWYVAFGAVFLALTSGVAVRERADRKRLGRDFVECEGAAQPEARSRTSAPPL